MSPTLVQFNFGGPNTAPAASVLGVNTLLLSAASPPTADIVALAATVGNTGTVNVPLNGKGSFAVAISNVGAAGTITASVDTGTATLPLTLTLCQTDPVTSACQTTDAPSVTFTVPANGTATFGVFAAGKGQSIPFNPASSRIFVRFKDLNGETRGLTSVAVRTQ